MSKVHFKAVLQAQPYRCLMCSTSKITIVDHILEHLNSKRHKNACKTLNISLLSTNSDGTCSLPDDLQNYLRSHIHDPVNRAAMPAVPLIFDINLEFFRARMSSTLPKSLLDTIYPELDQMSLLIDVDDVKDILLQHGIVESQWSKYPDNLARLKYIFYCIMRNNNLQLCMSLKNYFHTRMEAYRNMFEIWNNSFNTGKTDSLRNPLPYKSGQTSTTNETHLGNKLELLQDLVKNQTQMIEKLQASVHVVPSSSPATSRSLQCQPCQDVLKLQEKLKDMEAELQYYRETTQSSTSLLLQQPTMEKKTSSEDQIMSLKTELTNLQNVWEQGMRHYAEILSNTSHQVTSDSCLSYLIPNPNGSYPTINCNVLEEVKPLPNSKDTWSAMWKGMLKKTQNKNLPLPPLLLPPCLCRNGLFAVQLSFQRIGDDLWLQGELSHRLKVTDLSLILRLKIHLLVLQLHDEKRPNGETLELCRDTFATLRYQTGNVATFHDFPWHTLDPNKLPSIDVTITADVDRGWWQGFLPIYPNKNGVYEAIDCNKLGGNSDWKMNWKNMVNNPGTSSDLLWLPPLQLCCSDSDIVVAGFRGCKEELHIYIVFHKDMAMKSYSRECYVTVELQIQSRSNPLKLLPFRESIKYSIQPWPQAKMKLTFPVNWTLFDSNTAPIVRFKIENE